MRAAALGGDVHQEATPEGEDRLGEAIRSGRVQAQVMRIQRDLAGCADRHRDLFPAGPFDAALLCGVAAANAFGSPSQDAGALRVAARTALWIFGLDWRIDRLATERAEVTVIVRRCLGVADGGEPVPGDGLTGFLAEIRAELAAAAAFPDLGGLWRDELARMLDACAREWDWKAAHAADPGHPLPTLDEYLGNADNFGSAWVNLAHWIVTGGPEVQRHLAPLQEASRMVQQVLRLLNDLATYHRDRTWGDLGDLNALMLGVDRAAVRERITLLLERCTELIRPLNDTCPEQAAYLERQIGFSVGFYGGGDYWGAL